MKKNGKDGKPMSGIQKVSRNGFECSETTLQSKRLGILSRQEEFRSAYEKLKSGLIQAADEAADTRPK